MANFAFIQWSLSDLDVARRYASDQAKKLEGNSGEKWLIMENRIIDEIDLRVRSAKQALEEYQNFKVK